MIDRIRIVLNQLHPLVRVLIVGTVIVGTVQSMSAPYFAVYLTQHTHIGVISIGFIVGMGALAGTFGGFVGGFISDWLGRKFVIVCSFSVLALANFGYVVAQNEFIILGLIALSGFFGSFFGPTSKALMADVTAAELRTKVFSLQYTGTNIGYVIGPLLGILFGFLGGPGPFLVMGCVYTIYVGVIAILLGRTMMHSIGQKTNNGQSIWEVIRSIKSDRVLKVFVFGGLMTCLVHGKWSAPMSVYLTQHFIHGATIFSILLTTNAIVVIIFQPIMSGLMGKLKPVQNIIVGGILFAVGCMIFEVAETGFTFVLGMVVFTFGEVFIVPSEYTIIDEITPEDMRGAYYGAVSLSNLGSFLGPWVFSSLLADFKGRVMFAAMALCSVVSIVIYLCGYRMKTSTSGIVPYIQQHNESGM
jgi:MFS family permease